MDTSTNFATFLLILIVVKFVFNLYLLRRQKTFVWINRSTVPAPFISQISLPEHQKAAGYTIAKANYARWQMLLDFALLTFWLFAGGYAMLQQMATDLSTSSILQGLIFFALLAIITTIIGLPFDLYQTFVLEEKFGFNKTTPKLFFVDMLKQLLLTFIIGALLITVFLKLMDSLGQVWWIWGWGVLCLFQLLMMWAYPAFIAPLFNKFEPLQNEELKQRIENLLSRAGFHSKGLYVMDASKRSSHGNAYFTGFGKNKRIVFFDTLLKNLLPLEVEAVLAHELGHFKRKHIFKMICITFLLSFISFAALGYLAKQDFFYTNFKMQPATYAALALFMSILPAVTFFLTPVMSLFSRKHEYEADAYAALMSDASSLETALVKLYKENASTLTPDPWYSFFFHSHPAAWERIKHLQSLKGK